MDLDLKLVVVQHALKHGGIASLIHLGRGVHPYAHEPTHRAMVSAQHPVELVLRWQRLERYIHSRHRLRIAAQGEQWMQLTHEGVCEGIFPSVYESLVVFGVIAALLQARGVRGLAIHSGRPRCFRKRSSGPWRHGQWSTRSALGGCLGRGAPRLWHRLGLWAWQKTSMPALPGPCGSGSS